MADKVITIAKFDNYINANLAKQLLDDFGIKSIITGQNTANAYSGLSAVARVELQTFEHQAEKALAILKSQNEQEQ